MAAATVDLYEKEGEKGQEEESKHGGVKGSKAGRYNQEKEEDVRKARRAHLMAGLRKRRKARAETRWKMRVAMISSG